MILVTCKEDNCPTPHFYVNPKGGKIKFPVGVGADKLPHSFKTIQAMRSPLDNFLTDDEWLSKIPDEKLQELWYRANEKSEAPIQLNAGRTLAEKTEDTEDYLVVYCESDHKNYVLMETRSSWKVDENK